MNEPLDLDAIERVLRKPAAYDAGDEGMRRLLVAHMALISDASALVREARRLRALPTVKTCGACFGLAHDAGGMAICHYTDEHEKRVEPADAPPEWCPLRENQSRRGP